MVKQAFGKGLYTGFKNVMGKIKNIFSSKQPPKAPPTFELGQPPPPKGTEGGSRGGVLSSIKNFMFGTGKKPFSLESMYEPVELTLREVPQVMKRNKVKNLIYYSPGSKYHGLNVGPNEVEYFKSIHPQESIDTAKFKFVIPGKFKDTARIDPTSFTMATGPEANIGIRRLGKENLYEIGGKRYYNPHIVVGDDIKVPLAEYIQQNPSVKNLDINNFIKTYTQSLKKRRKGLVLQYGKTQKPEIKNAIEDIDRQLGAIKGVGEYRLMSVMPEEAELAKQLATKKVTTEPLVIKPTASESLVPQKIKHLSDIDENLFEIGGRQYYNPSLVLGKNINIPLRDYIVEAQNKGKDLDIKKIVSDYIGNLKKAKSKIVKRYEQTKDKRLKKVIKEVDKTLRSIEESKGYVLTSTAPEGHGAVRQILFGDNPNKTTADLIGEGGILNLIRHGYRFSPREKLLIDKLLRGKFTSLNTGDIDSALNIALGKGLPIYGLYQIGQGINWSNPQVGDIARMAYQATIPGFFHYGLIPYTVGDFALSSAIEKLPNTYLTNWREARQMAQMANMPQAGYGAMTMPQATPPADFVGNMPYYGQVYG